MGRRIVIWMIASSAVLSLLASAFQLYWSYQRDVARVAAELSVVETSFISGFENALWEFNFEQVNVLLDGIVAQPDIVAVSLVASTGQAFQRGEYEEGEVPSLTLPLFFTNTFDEQISVGQLSVWATFDTARQRLIDQLFTLLLSNFLKTMVASLVMLQIFEWFVARHLRSIADQVEGLGWLNGTAPIALPRRSKAKQDELSVIVSSLNNAAAKSREEETARRGYQQELRATKDELETIFNAASSGILALNANGTILRINEAARHMLGGLSMDTPMRWPERFYFMDAESHDRLDASADPIRRALSGFALAGETQLLSSSPSGEHHRYVRVSSAKVSAQDSDIFVVLIIDDISAEERNRQVVERKSRLDALGQLTGGIAHDFNNLLAAQLYAIDLAEKAQSDEDRARYMKIARSSISRGGHLTSRLLAFAKRQPGKRTSRPVADIFGDLQALIRPMIEESIRLEIEEEHRDAPVFCDHAQLETALMNLILNSRDAIVRSGKGNMIKLAARPVWDAPNGPEITELHHPGAKALVELSVTDNGMGMDAKTLARATDPFFTTKDSNSGTGLGLSMVYGFARQSDGEMRMYSDHGIGTTVRLTLPRGTEPDVVGAEPTQSKPLTGSNETILLVEDEPDLLGLMSDLLIRLNYRVVQCRSGIEAAEKVAVGVSFDLLLTDVVMPGGVSGFELAKTFRAALPDKPVIYMSGYTGYTKDEMGEVAAPLVQKPCDPYVLSVLIRNVLDAGMAVE